MSGRCEIDYRGNPYRRLAYILESDSALSLLSSQGLWLAISADAIFLTETVNRQLPYLRQSAGCFAHWSRGRIMKPHSGRY